ncbi:MAG: hypothetical protein ACRDRK_17710 [Pseudonocardia sp.]
MDLSRAYDSADGYVVEFRFAPRDARNAAVDQAATARESLGLQRAEYHQRDAPTFASAIQPVRGDHPAYLEVRMLSGPLAIDAAITYVNGGPDGQVSVRSSARRWTTTTRTGARW